MKTLLFIFLLFPLTGFLNPASAAGLAEADTTDADVPKTVHEAVFYLEEFLSNDELDLIRESDELEFVGNAVSGTGLGSWLINEWDLWSPTPLNVYFNRNGISNPPEMAEVILTSFHRYLNGRPMHINDQIREIRAFWENQEEQLEQRRDP